MFKCACGAFNVQRFFVIISRWPRKPAKKRKSRHNACRNLFLLKPSIILNLCLRVLFTPTKIDIIFQTNKFFEGKNEKSSTIEP